MKKRTTIIALVLLAVLALSLFAIWFHFIFKQVGNEDIDEYLIENQDTTRDVVSYIRRLSNDDFKFFDYEALLLIEAETILLPRFSLSDVDFKLAKPVSNGYSNLVGYTLYIKTATSYYYFDIGQLETGFEISNMAEDLFSQNVFCEYREDTPQNPLAVLVNTQDRYLLTTVDDQYYVSGLTRWASSLLSSRTFVDQDEFNEIIIRQSRRGDFLFSDPLSAAGIFRTGGILLLLLICIVIIISKYKLKVAHDKKMAQQNVIYRK